MRAGVQGVLALGALLFALPSARAQQLPPERLTLKQAVTLGLQKNRDLALARLQYENSQRDVGLTRSQFRPNLYAGSGVAYTSGFPLLATGGAPAIFSLSYDQTLFDLTARGQVRSAERRAEEQQLGVDAVRASVIVRVASTYLELAKVRQQLDLLHGERDSAQKVLDYIQQRADAGFELPIEVTKARLTSAQVEERIAQAEDQEDILADELRDLLGLDPSQPVEVTSEQIPSSGAQQANDLVAQALRSSTEIKQAEAENAASLATLRGQRGGRWPSIGIIGQYNLLGKFNNYDQFFNKFERNNVIVGLDVRIPVFASHSSAAIASAQANLNASQVVLENKRAQVSLDVRRKAHQLREADAAREVARLEMDLAQQNLQVLQAQYDQGRASIRDLGDAQLAENDKWLAFLDADFARQQAQLALLQSTGQVGQLFQ